MPASALALRILTSVEIARAVCLGDFFHLDEAAKARALWSSGIHDADVDFFTATTPLTESAARQALAKHSASNRRSFAFGECPTENKKRGQSPRAWVAAFRAPTAPIIEGEKIALPPGTGCRDFFVRSLGPAGRSSGVQVQMDGKFAIPAADGTVTVTCSHDEKDKTISRHGPELWFAFPAGKGPAAEVPGRNSILAQKDPAAGFIVWINHLRAIEKLPPVEPVTFKGAPNLTRNATALHDRKQLAKIADLAKKQHGLTLSGEDRVMAKTRDDAMWLLWNSPRHRDLLLAPEATQIMVQASQNNEHGLLITSLIFFSGDKHSRN
ncbi:MAG: hypothetical protein RIQ81_1216 [Pseudomonadota bacterium]|jgi:hypothetical protein